MVDGEVEMSLFRAVTMVEDAFVSDAGRNEVVLRDLSPLASMPPFSGVNGAALQVVESSGAGTTKPLSAELLFDAATDEGRMWVWQAASIPQSGDPYLRIFYRMASANTGAAVVMVAQVAALSSGDVYTGKVFAAANSSTITVPDAAVTLTSADIPLTYMDSLADGDVVCLVLYRDANDAADTASGDLILTGARVVYYV